MDEPITQYNTRWYQRAAIWIGIGINPASITLGGGLATRLPLAALYWLIPLGAFLISSIAVTAGIIGRRRREPFTKWAQSTFGADVGVVFLYGIMALGMIGWSGFQHGLAGTSFGNILGLPPWAGVVLLGIFWFVLVNAGTNKWNYLVWVTALASFGLVFISLGIAREQSVNPMPTDELTVETAVWVISSMLAFAALFSLRTTDFTWDMASDWDVALDGIAFFISLTISTFVGVLLFQSTGEWDLSVILGGTRLAILAQLFLVISLMGPALSTKHSGGLALGKLISLDYRLSVGVVVALGVLLGILRFDRQLLFFLDWVAAILPPAMTVMIGLALMGQRRVNTAVALIAWLAGAVVAVLIKLNGQMIHLIAGAGTSILILLIARAGLFSPNKKINAEAQRRGDAK